jgi:hypothetical protein
LLTYSSFATTDIQLQHKLLLSIFWKLFDSFYTDCGDVCLGSSRSTPDDAGLPNRARGGIDDGAAR